MIQPSKAVAWDHSQIARVRGMAHQGMKSGEIAAALQVSRGSIAGLCYRNKIKLAGTSPRFRAAATTSEPAPFRPSPRRMLRCAETTLPRDRDVKPGTWDVLSGQPVHFLDLEARQCRWPVGSEAERMFCGCATSRKSSYCTAHARMAVGGGE